MLISLVLQAACKTDLRMVSCSCHASSRNNYNNYRNSHRNSNYNTNGYCSSTSGGSSTRTSGSNSGQTCVRNACTLLGVRPARTLALAQNDTAKQYSVLLG